MRDAPFPFLQDGHPEDGIQERAWLPAEAARSPEAAPAAMAEAWRDATGDPLESSFGPGAHFVVLGREYLRAELEAYDGDEGGGDVETLRGLPAEDLAAEAGRLDELRYSKCEPDDDGAREWWKLELVAEHLA